MTAGTVPTAHEKPLAESLSQFRDRAFLFVEPGGNWGDGLIYLGAQTLARRLGLQWERLSYAEFIARAPGDNVTVYVHGSGGFNYLHSGKATAAFLRAVSHFPVRSFSVRRRLTTLKDSSRRRFCRDCVGRWAPTSRSSCVSALASIRSRAVCRLDIDLHLDHGMALQLTPEDALNGRAQAARYALLALRQDDEAPAGLSWGQFDGVRLDPAFYGRSFDHWVRIHALASRIITTGRIRPSSALCYENLQRCSPAVITRIAASGNTDSRRAACAGSTGIWMPRITSQ